VVKGFYTGDSQKGTCYYITYRTGSSTTHRNERKVWGNYVGWEVENWGGEEGTAVTGSPKDHCFNQHRSMESQNKVAELLPIY